MKMITLTIRGLDGDLITLARSKAARMDVKLSKWLNEAIREKLVKDALDLPFNLDGIAEPTEHEGVFSVPPGTIMVGSDYSICGNLLCAAGRKKGEEVVTSDSPGTLHNLGYEIFWVR
ncbi:MAG: hypothetical protein FJ316_03880 [SAR202 cluster bacterium]|nr:hypothetical protein [SAR202 cluster bacterium]